MRSILHAQQRLEVVHSVLYNTPLLFYFYGPATSIDIIAEEKSSHAGWLELASILGATAAEEKSSPSSIDICSLNDRRYEEIGLDTSQVPTHLMCPILNQIFTDPVRPKDSKVGAVERSALVRWDNLSRKSNKKSTHPLNRGLLENLVTDDKLALEAKTFVDTATFRQISRLGDQLIYSRQLLTKLSSYSYAMLSRGAMVINYPAETQIAALQGTAMISSNSSTAISVRSKTSSMPSFIGAHILDGFANLGFLTTLVVLHSPDPMPIVGVSATAFLLFWIGMAILASSNRQTIANPTNPLRITSRSLRERATIQSAVLSQPALHTKVFNSPRGD